MGDCEAPGKWSWWKCPGVNEAEIVSQETVRMWNGADPTRGNYFSIVTKPNEKDLREYPRFPAKSSHGGKKS